MWEKILLLVLVSILLLSFGIIVYGNYLDLIKAKVAHYPIIVDGEEVLISPVIIDDKVYLPIRSICEEFGFDVELTDDSKVEIKTNNYEDIEIGYYGKNGWTSNGTANFEVSKDVAKVLADDIFLQVYGNEFIDKTKIDIVETDDKKCYIVFRYEEGILGGDASIEIRKSDGKVLKACFGE